MIQSSPHKEFRTFWSERPLSHLERKLLANATAWINRALQQSGRPIYMLSLTCKQVRISAKGGLIPLTVERLWEALEIYFKRIDRSVYGNAARRFRKAVERFVVIEGGPGTGKPIHVHMLVVAPPGRYIAPLAFVDTMLKTWRSSPWGRFDALQKHDVDWRQADDLEGAIKYLLKTGLDAVDLQSTRF